jgi:aspartate carbamoyltransferase regulatory subunit
MKMTTVTIECCEKIAKDGPVKMQMNSETNLRWRCVYCETILMVGKEVPFFVACPADDSTDSQ